MTDDKIYLPAVLADNYGIPVEESLKAMQLGDVYVDGHEVSGRQFWFFPDALEGKKIEVHTAQKKYVFEYRPQSFRS